MTQTQCKLSKNNFSNKLWVDEGTEDQSVFINQSANLRQIFVCDLDKIQTEVVTGGKGPNHPQYSYNIMRIHSLMIYSDVLDYNRVGDLKFLYFFVSFSFP